MIFKDFVQIAGVRNSEEAKMLIECGVEYIGFPLRLDVHEPDTSEEEARTIIKSFPKNIKGILITYMNSASEINTLCGFLGVKVVQAHGDISENELSKLKFINPNISIIKSLVVAHDNFNFLRRQVSSLSPIVDAFITDTFDPETGASGATGKTHDWEISRSIVELSPKPVILAGGLNPANVKEAIRKVRPAGVDSHTGVENSSGAKDQNLVMDFLKNARDGFVTLHRNR